MNNSQHNTNSCIQQIEALIDRAFDIMPSDPNKSIEIAKSALELAESHNYRIGIGLAHLRIGTGYHVLNHIKQALENYYAAEIIFLKEKYYRGLRSTYNNLGSIYSEQNDLKKSLEYFYKNLELEKHYSDPQHTSSILNNIGSIYFQLNDMKKAVKSFNEALIIGEKSKDTFMRSVALNNLGNIYNCMGETTKATEYLYESIAVSKLVHNSGGVICSYIGLADVKSKDGQFDIAINLLNKALTISQNLNEPLKIARVYLQFAETYNLMDNIEKLKQYLKKCIAIAEPNNFRSLSLDAYTVLAKVFELESDFRSSTNCYKKIQELKDFINDEKRMRTVHEILTKMEVEKTEKENELLHQKNLELEKKNRLAIIRSAFDNIISENDFSQKHKIISESEPMNSVLLLMDQVASVENTDVLITGESGTGKELVARGIHLLSSRKQQIFFDVNCTAVPDNLFESEFFGHTKNAFTGAMSSRKGGFEVADKGTLFLDEIGDMPLALQTKLLRVLEERKIRRVGSSEDIYLDIRIIASTNQDLLKKVENNSFRKDLYYRLNKFNINIPPLRERPQDILPLINYYIKKFSHSMRKPVKSFSLKTIKILENYDFPGNVRELKNLVEKAVIMSRTHDKYLPLPDIAPTHYDNSTGITISEMANLDLSQFQNLEKEAIIEAMKRANNNQTKAAKLLKITRSSLQRRIIKFRLNFSNQS